MNQAEFIYVGEGINASVAVSRLSSGVLNYHNAGKVQASSEPQDMRLQRMLGHLTTIVPDQAGVGARHRLRRRCNRRGGVRSIRASSARPSPRSNRWCRTMVSSYFSAHNFDVVRNPKVIIRVDDARHYLLTTGEKFDAITSDPFDPWVKGAAILYSREFFELVKRRLNPGGVVTALRPALREQRATR